MDEYIHDSNAPPSPIATSAPGSPGTLFEPVLRRSATPVSIISTDEDIDIGENDDSSSSSELMGDMDD